MRFIALVGLITAAVALTGCDRSEPAAAPTQEGAPVAVQGPPIVVAPRPEPVRVMLNGQEVVAPPGSSVKLKTTTTRGASGTGAGISTDNAETAAGFNAGAPTSNLGGDLGGGADGGLSSANFKMRVPPGTSPLVWIGAACLLGAGACFYLQLRRAAIICAVLGLGFIGAEAVPGWAKAILFVAGLAGLGAYLWAEWQAKRKNEALRAVVAGVESIPDQPTRIGVKALIDGHAEDGDRAVIRQVKAADGLKSER